MISVQRLFIYPVKSCRGIEVDQADLVATGLRYDRHWMLVDPDGNFLSQRRYPQMTRIRTQLDTSELVCSSPRGELRVPLAEQKNPDWRDVYIWSDRCRAAIVSAAASRWFSAWLGVPCDLVYLPDEERRLVDPSYAHNRDIVSFADGFPLLVTSQASIDLLNDKLNDSLSIERFRPNIVVAGCAPHAEDHWAKIDITNITIDLVKPCSRCVIPTLDPGCGERHPLLNKTLASYRRRDGQIMFGMNGLHRQQGVIRRGMSVSATLV